MKLGSLSKRICKATERGRPNSTICLTKSKTTPYELCIATWYLLRLGIIDYSLNFTPSKKIAVLVNDEDRPFHEDCMSIFMSVAGDKSAKRVFAYSL